MRAIVLGKPDCGKCDAAKKNLAKLGVEFSVVDVSRAKEWHDGWRDDGSAEIRAVLELHDGHLPVILLDGVSYEYAAAMAYLKAKAREGGEG